MFNSSPPSTGKQMPTCVTFINSRRNTKDWNSKKREKQILYYENFNSDRVKTTKPCQANCYVSVTSIITQLKEVRNQIRDHSGEVENSADVLARLRENSIDIK